jgi:hypothetical protein
MKKMIILLSLVLFTLSLSACQRTITDYQVKEDGLVRFESLVFLDENQKNASFFVVLEDGNLYLARFSDDDDESIIIYPIAIEGNYTTPIFIEEPLVINSRYGGYLVGSFEGEKQLISLSMNREFLTGNMNGSISLSPLQHYIYVSYRWILESYVPHYNDGKIEYYDQSLDLLDADDLDLVPELLVIYDDHLYYVSELYDESTWLVIEENTDATWGIIYKGRYNTLNVSIITSDYQIKQCVHGGLCTDSYHINEEVIAHQPIFQRYMPGEVPFILVETQTRFIILNETQSLISVVAKKDNYAGYHVFVNGEGGYLAQYQIIDGLITRTLHRVVNFNDI